MPRPSPAPERFFAKVEKTDACWIWTAAAKTTRGRHLRMRCPLGCRMTSPATLLTRALVALVWRLDGAAVRFRGGVR